MTKLAKVSLDTGAELQAAKSEIVRLCTDLAAVRAELSDRTNRMINAERRAEVLFESHRRAKIEIAMLADVVYDPERRQRARLAAQAVRRRKEELGTWELRAQQGDKHAADQIEHARVIYAAALVIFFELAEETLALPPATGSDDVTA